MRGFTREQLATCDGQDGAPAYIASEGKVINVSRSFQWQRGRHQGRHRAGMNYTEGLEGAPHGAELLEQCPVVGILLTGS